MRPSGPDAPGALSRRRAEPLESLVIDGLPEHAVPVFEAALEQVCTTVAYFRDEPTDTWRIEGVREAGAHDEELDAALALAAAVAGIDPPAVMAAPVEAEGWLARTVQAFPEMPIGRRFLIRPTHVPDPALLEGGKVVGYLSLCPMTGLPQPRGVRLAAPGTLAEAHDRPPDAVLPVVLGLLPAPASAAEALRGGLQAGAAGIFPLLAGLGRDMPFGAHQVLGTLLALAGTPTAGTEARRLAGLDEEELAPLITAASQLAERRTGQEIPLWTAKESRALKAMIPAVPARQHWIAAARDLATLGAEGAARSEVMMSAALALWGRSG